jgi:uncharacterized protein (TIRG00374 family)
MSARESAVDVQGGEPPASAPRIPTGKALLLIGVLMLITISGLYVLLPALAGAEKTWHRLDEGDPILLLLAAGLEVLSFCSYVYAFRGVFGTGSIRIGMRDSYRITMAGLAATRLLATAGAGGVALTVWALARMGMPRTQIVSREAIFLVLFYAVFMGTLVVGGVGLYVGIFPGPAPFAITIVPAIFGFLVISVALLAARFSAGMERAARRVRLAEGRMSKVARALQTVPAALATGVRGAIAMVRARRPETLGAIGWWGFDISVLFVCLHAFGGSPPVAVVVMAYFVGMIANTLPVPGGVGAVDGGMIGALIAFDVDSGLAIVGVLSYRFFAFWLPIIPGVIAYVQLLRSEPAKRSSRSSDMPVYAEGRPGGRGGG